MPAKKKKIAAVETAPVTEAKPESAPAPASDEQSDAARLVNAALDEIADVKTRRNGLAKLQAKVEKQKAKLQMLSDEYTAAEAKISQAEAEIIGKYPKAAEMLGKSQGRRGRKPGATRGARTGKKKTGGGTALTVEQALQVYAEMPAEFELGAFNKKAREMHQGVTAKGAMKLLKDKVKKLGGKGMGMRYRKI
jgi:hypothetical protein